MRRLLLAVSLSISTFVALPARANEDFIWSGGYGDLEVGISLARAKKLWPVAIRADFAGEGVRWFVPSSGDDPDVCMEFELYEGSGLYLMFERGRLSRVTAAAPGYFTSKGLQVGVSAAQVAEALPTAVHEPAASADAPAHDLYWWDRPNAGIRFEIDDAGKVVAMYGGSQSIRYVEGCL